MKNLRVIEIYNFHRKIIGNQRFSLKMREKSRRGRRARDARGRGRLLGRRGHWVRPATSCSLDTTEGRGAFQAVKSGRVDWACAVTQALLQPSVFYEVEFFP